MCAYPLQKEGIPRRVRRGVIDREAKRAYSDGPYYRFSCSHAFPQHSPKPQSIIPHTPYSFIYVTTVHTTSIQYLYNILCIQSTFTYSILKSDPYPSSVPPPRENKHRPPLQPKSHPYLLCNSVLTLLSSCQRSGTPIPLFLLVHHQHDRHFDVVPNSPPAAALHFPYLCLPLPVSRLAHTHTEIKLGIASIAAAEGSKGRGSPMP